METVKLKLNITKLDQTMKQVVIPDGRDLHENFWAIIWQRAPPSSVRRAWPTLSPIPKPFTSTTTIALGDTIQELISILVLEKLLIFYHFNFSYIMVKIHIIF